MVDDYHLTERERYCASLAGKVNAAARTNIGYSHVSGYNVSTADMERLLALLKKR